MTWLVQFAIAELAACGCAAACALAGLQRLEPGTRIRLFGLAVSSLSGGVCAAAILAFAGASSAASCAGPAAVAGLMLLCPFLAVAACADFVSGWAPEELSVPICIFLGAVSATAFSGAGSAIAAAIGTGLLVFCVCRLVWRIQLWLGIAAVPPADCLAILAPAALFGLNSLTAAHYAIVALLLALVRLVPPVRRALSSNGAVNEESECGRAIRFLPVSFPVTLMFLVASIPLGQGPCGWFA